MFEFHGWAAVSYHTHDTSFDQQEALWSRVEAYVRELPTTLVRTQRHNGVDSVIAAGNSKRREDHIIQLFQWLSDVAPGAYGLLYIRDDEDTHRGADHSNVFRVWRLCRGRLSEEDAPFLSPAIPIVEDEWDPTRND